MNSVPYRKLPGHRRGFLRGASVWMGPDYLLAVRSMRFREEYKRFYLRDVRAIAVARQPRFHISTRAIFVGVLWLVAYLYFRTGIDSFMLPAAGVGLVVTWIYVSASCSCACRIYTAVSRDELPSVYRIWTARKFLAAVEPKISEVQGAIEGNWTELIETSGHAPAPPEAAPQPIPLRGAAKTTTYLLSATLFADAILRLMTLETSASPIIWILWIISLTRIVASILIIIQHQRGLQRAMLRKLAIIILISAAGLYYLQHVAWSMEVSFRIGQLMPLGIGRGIPMVLHRIGIAAGVILDIAGLLIISRAKKKS